MPSLPNSKGKVEILDRQYPLYAVKSFAEAQNLGMKRVIFSTCDFTPTYLSYCTNHLQIATEGALQGLP
jgi:hypothetical protein